LTEFIHLLEVHGADRKRWPLDRIGDVDELLRVSPDARRCLAEAKALDGLLAHAVPPQDMAAASLVDDIIAAAAREAHQSLADDAAASKGTIISWPGAGRKSRTSKPTALPAAAADNHALRGSARPVASHLRLGRSAAFLAASLLLGIYIGIVGGGSSAVQALAEAAGVSLGYDETEVTALDLGDLTGLDEEAL